VESRRCSALEANMAVMTHKQIMNQHIRRLLETERLLVAEARRVEHGLVAVRRQIALERQTLEASSEDRTSPAGQLAA
jgi:hypothetical protein